MTDPPTCPANAYRYSSRWSRPRVSISYIQFTHTFPSVPFHRDSTESLVCYPEKRRLRRRMARTGAELLSVQAED